MVTEKKKKRHWLLEPVADKSPFRAKLFTMCMILAFYWMLWTIVLRAVGLGWTLVLFALWLIRPSRIVFWAGFSVHYYRCHRKGRQTQVRIGFTTRL